MATRDFGPGDRVRDVNSEVGVVMSSDGEFAEVAFATGIRTVALSELTSIEPDPVEKIVAGQLHPSAQYCLFLQAKYLLHAYRYDPLSGLSNARVEPMPHQVFVAHRVATRTWPRMILADEVGLGKTVEAGLILKELIARGLVSRVLIVCPANLVEQWRAELAIKFNEEFDVFDASAVKYFGKSGKNPWKARDKVICSVQFASARADHIVEAGWDLAVFDEAHRLHRRKQGKKWSNTKAYAFADELKENVDGLLLLTATPMQLDPSELYSLIELIEPGLFPTYDSYDKQSQTMPALMATSALLRDWEAFTPEKRAVEAANVGGILLELGIASGEAATALASPQRREAAMERLVAMHPHTEVMVRNRKSEVSGIAFQPRSAKSVLFDLTPAEAAAYAAVSDYIRYEYNLAIKKKRLAVGFVMVTYQRMLTSSTAAIVGSFRRRIAKLQQQRAEADSANKLTAGQIRELRESEELTLSLEKAEAAVVEPEALTAEVERIRGLLTLLEPLTDTKSALFLDAVLEILAADPQEKLLVFTQFIETQMFLADLLRNRGIRVSVFNGRMKPDDKEAAVYAFRTEHQVLISTEAGGEGRNLQFCHLMINYDLPWNPMKIEQRIGRIDRIGQTRPIQIWNLATNRTVESRILDVLQHRINVFEQSVGSLDPILGEVEAQIRAIVMSGDFSGFPLLERKLQEKVNAAREKERKLSDFVLDRASFRQDEANELLARRPLARRADLARFIKGVSEYYGGHFDDRASDDFVDISLSARLSAQAGLKERRFRGVFDFGSSLESENVDFFAFGHPMVDALVGLPISDQASAGARQVRDARIAPGTYLEVVYELAAQGVRPAGLMVRHVVGEHGVVLSERLSRMPDSGVLVDDPAVPEWVPAAYRTSRTQLLRADYRAERQRLDQQHETQKAAELERARRIHDYQESRLTMGVREQEAWIREKSVEASPSDMKIMPARMAKLEKAKERLASLSAEYDCRCGEIRSKRLSLQIRVVAAGLAVVR